MPAVRQVITTLNRDGSDQLGMKTLALKMSHEDSIVSGSLLTVESTQFCVLKSRGVVLNTYDMGQYALQTGVKPILGSLVQTFWNGQAPWVYEIIYINRCKLMVRSEGVAASKEMAEVRYVVDYYIHIDDQEGALKLITHLPFNGTSINTDEISYYAGPAIEQAINQIIQLQPLERINEKIVEIRESVLAHLTEFLANYGIHLNDLKILILPKDDRMRELISLRAFGFTPPEASRFMLAMEMAKQGLITAPNAMAGTGFSIGANAMATVPTETLLPLDPPRQGG